MTHKGIRAKEAHWPEWSWKNAAAQYVKLPQTLACYLYVIWWEGGGGAASPDCIIVFVQTGRVCSVSCEKNGSQLGAAAAVSQVGTATPVTFDSALADFCGDHEVEHFHNKRDYRMCLAVVIGRQLRFVKLYLFFVFGNVYIWGSALAFHHADHVMQTATCWEYLQTHWWSVVL